jgi:cytochrome c oxidase cbb3-type subunit IV
MDLNLLRSLATVLAFVSFIGLVVWAWSRSRRSAFDEAAHLPFDPAADGELQSPEKAR